jgi:hypothetical protein
MPMAMDRPPMPPPDISGQMGQAPTGPATEPGLASMMPPGGTGQQGAVDPNGELVAQTEAVKRVLEQIVRLNPIMAPFAQKCITILDTGLSAVSTSPPTSDSPGGGIGAIMAAKQAPPMA